MNCKYKRGQHVKLLGSCRKCSILYTATANNCNNKIFILDNVYPDNTTGLIRADVTCIKCNLTYYKIIIADYVFSVISEIVIVIQI